MENFSKIVFNNIYLLCDNQKETFNIILPVSAAEETQPADNCIMSPSIPITRVGAARSAISPTPNCPSLLLPQENSLPESEI